MRAKDFELLSNDQISKYWFQSLNDDMEAYKRYLAHADAITEYAASRFRAGPDPRAHRSSTHLTKRDELRNILRYLDPQHDGDLVSFEDHIGKAFGIPMPWMPSQKNGRMGNRCSMIISKRPKQLSDDQQERGGGGPCGLRGNQH
jgi:hypothetical protein